MRRINILLMVMVCLWLPLFMGAFDKDKPAASTSLRSSNPQLLANQAALQAALDNEHIFTGTAAGTQTGDHTQGSARCFSQATAPATRIDAAGFLSTDLGSIWVDTDDNAVYVLTATTPTWTPVSTEIIATLLAAGRIFGSTLGVTGDFAVNTDKVTIAAATGNTGVAGTLDVAGATELVGIATIADESITKTTAAPTTDAMIANKKYIDDQIAFSAYTNLDSDSAAMLKEHAYLAATDGFVSFNIPDLNVGTEIRCYVGATNDPAGAGDEIWATECDSTGSAISGLVAVPKGKYFEIVATTGVGTPVIRWMSRGTLSAPVDQD